jgi:hypothetical protein
MRVPRPLYRRPLPGGGYVSIESTSDSSEAEVRASLLVERRADPLRRIGHAPPIVAEAIDRDPQRALAVLVEIATNNVEVAKYLKRWQSRMKS